jgi:hypothetical protein
MGVFQPAKVVAELAGGFQNFSDLCLAEAQARTAIEDLVDAGDAQSYLPCNVGLPDAQRCDPLETPTRPVGILAKVEWGRQNKCEFTSRRSLRIECFFPADVDTERHTQDLERESAL